MSASPIVILMKLSGAGIMIGAYIKTAMRSFLPGKSRDILIYYSIEAARTLSASMTSTRQVAEYWQGLQATIEKLIPVEENMGGYELYQLP